MDDSNQDGLLGKQWRQFEQFFGEKFQFPAQGSLNDLSWVESYVQNALKQAMTKSFEGMTPPSSIPAKSETFQTVSHVILKIHISDKEKAKNTRVYVGNYQVRLEERVRVQQKIISLPAPVIPESCKAIYKDGILQLYLKKQKLEDHFHEARIRFLN